MMAIENFAGPEYYEVLKNESKFPLPDGRTALVIAVECTNTDAVKTLASSCSRQIFETFCITGQQVEERSEKQLKLTEEQKKYEKYLCINNN